MQTINWLSFGVSNAVANTVVHFYPSAGNVSAPYPAYCKLRWFTEGHSSKTMTIEGPRLSQPDGVRLDAVFSELTEGINGFVGLEVGLSTTQPRINLSTSSCIIEFVSRAYSARFRPVPNVSDSMSESSEEANESLPKAQHLALADSFNSTSVVVVNSGEELYTPTLLTAEEASLALGTVAPASVKEFPLVEQLEKTEPEACSWGLLRSSSFCLAEPLPRNVVAYVLYRSSVTKLPVSVCSL